MEARFTLAKKGSKTVSVKGADSSNRCTIMLGANANGEKLLPYIVFKGMKGGRISQEISQQLKEGYPDDVVLAVQENAWFDEEIMLDWIENCWKKHTVEIDDKQMYYLILDSFAVHMTSKVREAFSRCNTEIDYVPEGFTSRLQVMDVGVNKPFKGYIRDEFDDWLVANSGKKIKPTRQVVSNWIRSAFNSVSKATLDNSWRRAMDLSISNDNDEETTMEDDDDDDFLILSPFTVGEVLTNER
jgi:DDE superfamily endonuclease